jgi:hypothetical protein
MGIHAFVDTLTPFTFLIVNIPFPYSDICREELVDDESILSPP